MDWTTFFVVSAGASATLVGLLFIGVQINIERFGGDAQNPWSTLARSTYTTFAILFLGSMAFVVPSISDRERALIVLVLSAAGMIRALRGWRGIRGVAQLSSVTGMTIFVLPLLGYGSAIAGTIALLRGSRTPEDEREMISLGFWFLYAVALRNSWSLLFDVRQTPPATR